MLRVGSSRLLRRIGKRFREDSSSSDEKMDDSESLNIHLVEIIHKKNLRNLYDLDKDFKVTDVMGNIGLFVGDHVVEFMGVDLRGKPYETYRNEKIRLKPSAKVTLLVLRRNSDSKCLQPDFSLPKPKQTQFYCWECGKLEYLKSMKDYEKNENHILTCHGLKGEPEEKGEPTKENKLQAEIVVKPSPKRLNASLFAPTPKLTITFQDMAWRWHDFWDKNKQPKNKRKVVSVQFIEEVFTQTGIPIVEYPTSDPVKDSLYEHSISTLRRRFDKKLESIKEAGGFSKAKIDYEEVMFNLESTQPLIDMNCYDPPDLPDSQGSDFSIRLSQLSNIEEEVPYPEPEPEPDPQPPAAKARRKDLDQCTPKYQREKMNQLFKVVDEFCENNGMNFTTSICKMGSRYNYVHDRKLAGTFKEIEKGNFTLPFTMPIEDAVYVKSRFIHTQRKWNNYKLFHSNYVSVPPYAKLSQYIHKIIPTKIKFENGFRLPLRTVAKETLERLPDKVSQSFDLIKH